MVWGDVSYARDSDGGEGPGFGDEFFAVWGSGEVMGVAGPFGQGILSVTQVVCFAVAAFQASGGRSAICTGKVQGHAGFLILR
jgi:hypothetical protein